MNINSYTSTPLNTYSQYGSGQTVTNTQNTQNLPEQNSQNQVNSTAQSSTAGNDYSVNLSQEARNISLNSSQTAPPQQTTDQTQQTQQGQQNQQTQEVQQAQQNQQIQSQLYQSQYTGQFPVSSAGIDLLA